MRRLVPFVVLATVVGCKCESVKTIKPSILVAPPALDFGPVKNADSTTRSLRIDAQTNADVIVSKIEVMTGTDPGGVEGFTVKMDPITVPALTSANLPISFHPTVLQQYGAQLILTTNDEDHPTVRVPLLGQGAKPIMTVTPECSSARMCKGTATVSPPSIDYGGEPYMRAMPIDASKLPSVNITNDGDVNLVVTGVSIRGTDPAAFKIVGAVTTPLEYEPNAGVSLPIRFSPLSESQTSYSADLIIDSDDPDHASVTVHLTGTLAPNQAPVVCANLIQVTPSDDSPRDYRALWPQVLTVPTGGYDFSATRDVEPRSTIVFSALSDTDPSHCTTDPEDGRTGLTYQWIVLTSPQGSPPLGQSTADRFQLTPTVSGDYVIRLTVTDMQGHSTVVPIKFAAVYKRDLTVQLQWLGYQNVDFDLHLVRPSSTTPGDRWSGAYSYFNEGPNLKTSGDLNGYSNNKLPIWGSGLDFDWGQPGTPDDPKLNIDDKGVSDLLESISLNYPERDDRCDGGRCAYRVYVHYFKDARAMSPNACFADGTPGCSDGEQCACPATDRCVATPPGDGGRPLGAGECRAAPRAVVKIFLKGSATPAATIPVAPNEVVLGAPCAMAYVADVNWPSQQEIGSLPDGGSPLATITDRSDGGVGRFGRRQTGDLSTCSPDVSLTQWYSFQPN